MAKRLLIIDNDDLTESIEKINTISKKKNLNIECYPLLIGLPDGNDVVDESGKISQELISKKFEEKYGNIRFHMIASDFKLNDERIDGVDIIRKFNNIKNTARASKILYSSELEEIVQKYLDDYKDEKKDFESSWANFKTLIKLNILDFTKREIIEESIINYIEKINDQEEDFVLDELLANSDLIFNPSIEIYEGLTFAEIAEKISANDSQSIKFKKKF